MRSYIAKRVLLFIPTLLLVTLLIFLILRVVPGDPAIMLLAGGGGGNEEQDFTQEALEKLRAELGTDRPIYVQYGDWIWNMLQLDFGNSYYWKTPIIDDLKQRFPITMELTLLAMLLAGVVAIPMGVISAIKQDTAADYITRLITIAGIAFPNFWIAILIVVFLVLAFDWIPPLGYADLWNDPGTNMQQMVFPALALAFTHMAFIARVTRSSMLEVFREDYIRTARSKGLSERLVIYRHALKNALLPVVTVGGYEFGRLLAGTVIIEVIFMVPGVGRLLISSIQVRDFPLVQGVIVMITVIVLVLNMVLDLTYAWLNPRIRYA